MKFAPLIMIISAPLKASSIPDIFEKGQEPEIIELNETIAAFEERQQPNSKAASSKYEIIQGGNDNMLKLGTPFFFRFDDSLSEDESLPPEEDQRINGGEEIIRNLEKLIEAPYEKDVLKFQKSAPVNSHDLSQEEDDPLKELNENWIIIESKKAYKKKREEFINSDRTYQLMKNLYDLLYKFYINLRQGEYCGLTWRVDSYCTQLFICKKARREYLNRVFLEKNPKFW